jgi:hypothetical protein
MDEKIKARISEVGLTAKICAGMVVDWVDGYCQVCRHYFDTPQQVHFGAKVYSLRQRADIPAKGSYSL